MPVSSCEAWKRELDRFLAPFLRRYERAAQRRWAPVYVQGLIGPGERKSVTPMAQRLAPGDSDQLHHFIAVSPWALAPLGEALVRQADRRVGGDSAVLVVDDTALIKKGTHSVGVAAQYCGVLGKTANCQVLVSLTLAQDEVPMPVGLRLFLPAAWAQDGARRAKAGVPVAIEGQPKWRIALDEIDRVVRAGARFGCVVGDAEYGKVGAFRHGLGQRGHRYALAILPSQGLYPAAVQLRAPTTKRAKHPRVSAAPVSAAAFIKALPDRAWRTLAWRQGTKGKLRARFTALRVRPADGPAMSSKRHQPGNEAWLVCEERRDGARTYYLSNLPAGLSRRALVRWIKARWVCEQAHQQMKDELGLDHFEGRSWQGLHHHALMTMIAFAFLQQRRLAQARKAAQKNHGTAKRGPAAAPLAARRAAPGSRGIDTPRAPMSALSSAHRLPATPMSVPK